MGDTAIWQKREVEKTITDLRNEVSTQKECITRYMFTAISFTTLVWGLVFKFEGNGLPFYFCNTLLIFLLLVVVRMANHKYSTVNRNLGYELHLSRLKDYVNVGEKEWTRKMLDADWEEAMCAWRFVQPGLFDHVYEPNGNSFWNIFRIHRRKLAQLLPGRYYWYDTKSLLVNSEAYHPGNYLRNIHWILHTVGGFSIFIMWCFYAAQISSLNSDPINSNAPPPAVVTLYVAGTTNLHTNPAFIPAKPPEKKELDRFRMLQCLITPLVMVAITAYFYTQIRRQGSRRVILEGELLSIQSCAVMWRIVMTCHILAVAWAFRTHNCYRRYTTYTSALAADLTESDQFDDPHRWLQQWEDCFGTQEMYRRLEKILGKYDQPNSEAKPAN